MRLATGSLFYAVWREAGLSPRGGPANLPYFSHGAQMETSGTVGTGGKVGAIGPIFGTQHAMDTLMATLSGKPVSVLGRYPVNCQPTAIESLGSAGGFSGAQFWRLDTPRGRLCLRRWPIENPSCERLQFIHAVLTFAAGRGFDRAALPIAAVEGETFVRIDDHLWELTTWLPGRADYFPERRPEKLRAAMTALAQWHLAAEAFSPNDRLPRPSPNAAGRLRQIDDLLSGDLRQLADRVASSPLAQSVDWIDLAKSSTVMLSEFERVAIPIRDELQAVAKFAVRLQPCIRDVWHDHLLFLDDEVSGLIDFGAMQIDSVATDVARLLGSLSEDEPTVWEIGLAAYRGQNPLSPNELSIMRALNRSEALLSGINWIRWIFVDGRRFAEPAAAQARMTAIFARFQRFGGRTDIIG